MAMTVVLRSLLRIGLGDLMIVARRPWTDLWRTDVGPPLPLEVSVHLELSMIAVFLCLPLLLCPPNVQEG